MSLSLGGLTTENSASISGSNLWNLTFFSSDDGLIKTASLPVPTLSSEQKNLSMEGNQSFDFMSINVSFSTENLTCDQLKYLCFTIEQGAFPIPEFSLGGNTTGCTTIDCIGK